MVYFPQTSMLRLTVIAASLAALALPLEAGATSVIGFDRASASPNERVKVTSALSVPLRLYLVSQDDARRVTSRTDRRLSFIGVVKANRSLTFSMPPLDAGTYRLASWDGAKLRTRAATLRLRSTVGCPVTLPNGNRPPGQPRNVQLVRERLSLGRRRERWDVDGTGRSGRCGRHHRQQAAVGDDAGVGEAVDRRASGSTRQQRRYTSRA